MNPATRTPIDTTVATWAATLTPEQLARHRAHPKVAKSVWRKWAFARLQEAIHCRTTLSEFKDVFQVATGETPD